MTGAPLPPLLVTLLERLGGQEALEIEFKAAQGGLPQSMWQTVSAFANTRGGWLLLGVKEAPGGPVFEGIRNPSALMQEITNLLRNKNKISYPLCGVSDLTIDTTLGQPLLIVRVPAAPRKERPVYINGNPYTGTYLRRHTGDYLCTKSEVDRMMREASDITADSTILPHFGLDDLDPDALASYRRRFQTRQHTSHLNSYDDLRFLASIGGFGRDRETGREGLTVAGLLLLGKAEALQAWRPRHLIDFRLRGHETTGRRWDDRLPWDGNLLGAFDALYPRLIADLPTPFRLEGSTRIDEGPLHVALREALVNLLVHADYAESDASLIIRSLDGYLFRNPGNSRLSQDDLLTGDRSDPRNPVLVRMFRRIGLAEEAGSGIPSIVHAWRDLGFQLPDIDIGTERYEFSLGLRYAHLLSEDDRRWLQLLGETWSEQEQLALVCARHERQVDNVTLRRLAGLHPTDATKVLGNLRDRGLLQMVSSGRGAHYILGTAAYDVLQSMTSATVRNPSDGAIQLSLTQLATSSKDSSPSIGDKGTYTTDKGESSEDNLKGSVSNEAELMEIARLARTSARLDPARRNAIIVELCTRTPLSVRQLAALMKRSDALILEAVRELVAIRQLAYLYPAQPRHPRQKYVARSQSPAPE